MVHWKLLTRNHHGTVIIHDNTNQAHSAIHQRTLQIKWPIQWRWMNIHVNYMSNVWTPTSGHYLKQFTHTMLGQKRIIPGQTYTSIIVTYVETHFIHIGSRQFCNWVCWMWVFISSNECIENVLWKNHNRLGREILLWNNHEIGLCKRVCRHLDCRICKRSPAPIQS